MPQPRATSFSTTNHRSLPFTHAVMEIPVSQSPETIASTAPSSPGDEIVPTITFTTIKTLFEAIENAPGDALYVEGCSIIRQATFQSTN